MRSKFEFASEAERRRYEKLMERKSRLNITGADKMDPIWGLKDEDTKEVEQDPWVKIMELIS